MVVGKVWMQRQGLEAVARSGDGGGKQSLKVVRGSGGSEKVWR
jgi:hypothetical protein